MKVEIEWKERGNFQTKTFKDQNACMQWCRTNCRKIYSINGIYTYCQELSHFDIMDCLTGRGIDLATSAIGDFLMGLGDMKNV